jgi:hypothetical protein
MITVSGTFNADRSLHSDPAAEGVAKPAIPARSAARHADRTIEQKQDGAPL